MGSFDAFDAAVCMSVCVCIYLCEQDVLEFSKNFFANYTSEVPQAVDATKAPPLVIAGPSGVGKGTLINMLLERYPSHFGFSVSHTTRAPRPGEVNGVHYHFVDRSHFERGVGEGLFLEHANVHTNMYGTSISAVQAVQAQGKVCVLDIDIQGVKQVKQCTLSPAPKFLFVAPPSMEELERRLRGRGTETEEKIQVRVHNAAGELEYGLQEGNFDKVLRNECLETAMQELLDCLKKWYPHLKDL
jgi:guanylate kinase